MYIFRPCFPDMHTQEFYVFILHSNLYIQMFSLILDKDTWQKSPVVKLLWIRVPAKCWFWNCTAWNLWWKMFLYTLCFTQQYTARTMSFFLFHRMKRFESMMFGKNYALCSCMTTWAQVITLNIMTVVLLSCYRKGGVPQEGGILR